MGLCKKAREQGVLTESLDFGWKKMHSKYGHTSQALTGELEGTVLDIPMRRHYQERRDAMSQRSTYEAFTV